MYKPGPFFSIFDDFMIHRLLFSVLILLVTATAAVAYSGPGDSVAAAAPPLGISVQRVKHPGRSTDKYVLFLPDAYYTDKTKRWPVLIFLHGKGERGDDINLVKQMGIPHRIKNMGNFPFIVIAPQCKLNVNTWDVPSLNAMFPDILQYRVDTNRIYLTGLSMGGNGTWMWGMNSPDKFAALAPICGWGNPALACVLKDKPMKVFHNTDDDTVPVNGSRKLVNAVKNCGGTRIDYTERPTGGHDAWSIPYYDYKFYEWLLKQKKA